MTNFRDTLLSLVAVSATLGGVSAQLSQSLQVIWSTTHFDTISGPSGNEIGHGSGFALTDADGIELFSAVTPVAATPATTQMAVALSLSQARAGAESVSYTA